MKPFGTITMYFPFLTHEEKKTVEALVDDALSYYDFVRNLVELAGEYPVDSDLGFFALIRSASYPKTWKRMQEKCKEFAVTKPLTFYEFDTYDTLKSSRLDELEVAMEQAISSNPNKWILVHLYIVSSDLVPEPLRSHYLRSARNLIDVNQELQRFMYMIHVREGYTLRIQGDIEGAIRAYDEAFKIADEYDDVASAAAALVQKANTLKDIDIHRALELHDEIYSMLTNRISEFDAIYMVAVLMALCYEALGEYDLALNLLFKGFEATTQASDEVQTTLATIVSRIYCTLEMPGQALEWLKAKGELHTFEETILHSAVGVAFILQEKLEDAARHLVLARNSATMGGDDQLMGDYLYAKGLYELAIGDLNNAIATLEQALKLANPQFQIHVNLCLLALTRCEILEGLEAPIPGSDKDYYGPWMKRLEEHATEKDYPGVRMQHALLKASYQTQIGEHEMARLTLENALTISDSPGVKTLRMKIEKKLEELDSIEQEQT